MKKTTLLLLTASVLLLAACGQKASTTDVPDVPQETATPVPTDEPTATP